MNAPTSLDAARPARWSAVVGIALVAASIGAGWVLWRRPTPPLPRPALGDLVLLVSHDLANGPLDRRLLAPGPSVFSIDVTTPVDVTVTLGPPEPSTSSREGGPDPAHATVLHAKGGERLASDVRVDAAGITVLRVEPRAPADGGAPAAPGPRVASIRVERRPGP